MRVDGRQVTMLASSNSEAIAQAGRERNAVTVEVMPVSLREIFLETVQMERAGQEQQNALV